MEQIIKNSAVLIDEHTSIIMAALGMLLVIFMLSMALGFAHGKDAQLAKWRGQAGTEYYCERYGQPCGVLADGTIYLKRK